MASNEFAALRRIKIVDNCLEIGGGSVVALAERVGRTPFYVYERDEISKRVGELRHHLPAQIKLHYAIKANPMPEVVQHLATLVDGFDIASVGELRVALATATSPQHISFAGPGKTREELAAAVAADIVINVESERELDAIDQLAQEQGRVAQIAIRVNPDFELKSSGMKMSGGAKPFGIDAECVPALLAQDRWRHTQFIGLHIYCGSQNLRSTAIIEAQQKTFELASRLLEHAPQPARWLNIGGGFGIPYFAGDEPLDLAPIGANLHKMLIQYAQRLSGIEIIVELGRYIVGEAGVYICRVIDRKISRGQVFLVTDGGLHHHLAASGNFGQVLRKNYPVIVANKAASLQREIASVVGPLCTPLDVLADKMDMAAAEVGDLIAVMQSGAYGATASPINFLSHPPPREILI